jgi:AcrR family transcriptional regulator
MSEEIRRRILAAAARVYAQYGSRGATTRLIATAAGVNEVTLFRTFGSKAQLLQAMLHAQTEAGKVPLLPDQVGDPIAELTVWAESVQAHLREHAHLIRKTIGEALERPDAACAACERPNNAGQSLVLYLENLRELGLIDADADVDTAKSMLMATMFGDALYRDIMPERWPEPAEDAPAKYVQVFARSVGLRAETSTELSVRSRPRRVAGTRRRAR